MNKIHFRANLITNKAASKSPAHLPIILNKLPQPDNHPLCLLEGQGPGLGP